MDLIINKDVEYVETDKYACHIWLISSYYDKCMHTQKNCSLKKKNTCPLGLKSIVAKIN